MSTQSAISSGSVQLVQGIVDPKISEQAYPLAIVILTSSKRKAGFESRYGFIASFQQDGQDTKSGTFDSLRTIQIGFVMLGTDRLQ
ncbi:MAG: hypothetical protein R2769_14595 [Saprospiraceae bacterium]